MNKFKLLICLLLISSGLRAQTRQIQGTVVSSDDGQPLIGVTVLIEGTTQGTSSNADGSWQLAVPDNGNPVKLSFSYIGYETQVHTVAAGQTMLNVRLSASSLELEEVVAIGYGVMRKSDVTGALLSATNAENQQIAKQTPSFTPKNVKSGVFVLFKIIQPLHNKRVAILKESDEKRLIFIYPFTLIFQDFTSS